MTSVCSQAISEAADRLAQASKTGETCAPIRDLIGREDIDAAYRVQSRNIEVLLASGRRIIGRKIGLTSPAVQHQLGVDQPDFGVLLDDMDCTNDTAVDITRLLQPKIEAEIAFVLRADIAERITAEQAPEFVDGVFAAFEIVDSRVANWDISLADTVADNASAGLYVLGERVDRVDAPDLAEVTMTVSADGAEVSRGKGADCLGSPWEALAWLAATSLEYGAPLRSGDVILSGALGPMVPVTAGSTYTATISGIGSVTARFTTISSEAGKP
ncbi:fumarylacetoacetate hydrolase family protein [Mycobacterium frederiksbergense]|uniref:Fumarylacetoacetate hydrolase family protein n=4 Tax=Mycobacteriaceae TaxID=1762 RepID=A0A9X3BS60_9MYCO|nr:MULTISPECIES: fumarylacetoacetate hydrolase family protein [Mycolicibacterium]KGI65866.1 2-keto-4-pentenoate hydratase [Mycolicibacterium rufum]MCV7048965.1 fumarylacetoacetate hydrolase family protein [Mycolicibacterium frederiksbergense]MCV7074277.1 fumarylacetoacetate hydrolase family protein [Mycolicibacterium rufum]MCV7131907.1 fumarylacetoacetate hydrolase family protein [Mycolicibacterium hodleri]QIV83256.1 2-keto-4-pentenoate hydratase [Mycolicibacterium frederiksbergense]